jgi:hypothetical protein
MTTVARASKQIIQTYKAVRGAEGQTQAKLYALLETNALYKLFDLEDQHPYYKLANLGKRTLTDFEELVAGVMGWLNHGSTIGDELDKKKARQIVNEEEADDDLDALRLINPITMTEAEAADKLLSVCRSAIVTASWCEKKIIDYELEKLHGKKLVKRHKESPEIKVSSECRAAVREMKKLGKVLRDCGNGSSTVRRELEKKQVLLGLTGQSKDGLIESLLKP